MFDDVSGGVNVVWLYSKPWSFRFFKVVLLRRHVIFVE